MGCYRLTFCGLESSPDCSLVVGSTSKEQVREVAARILERSNYLFVEVFDGQYLVYSLGRS